MSDEKISNNEAIDAALHLDGDPQNVKQFYEDWAKNYNLDTTSSDYIGPAISAKLLSQYLSAKDSKLLDAGCGTGLVGIELKALGYDRVDGFDLSDSMAEQAIATGAYQQVLGGIDMMRAAENYADANYAAILSVGVFTLGHVPPEALIVLLQLASPGGLLLISTRTHYYDQTNFQLVMDDLVDSGQLGADEIFRSLWTGPGGTDGGNDQPVNIRRRFRMYRPGAVHVRDAVLPVDGDIEQGIGVIRIRGGQYGLAIAIGERHIDINEIQREVREAVIDPHVGIKGLALEGQLLQDFDLHLGTQ